MTPLSRTCRVDSDPDAAGAVPVPMNVAGEDDQRPPINIGFGEADQSPFASAPTQNARVWTEDWYAREMYCPGCSHDRLTRLPNNSPVADFVCSACLEEFELKGTRGVFGPRVVDGAYEAMKARLQSDRNPNLALLRYHREERRMIDCYVIPKHFFTIELIEQRRPLGPNAKRAGWVGCNIRLSGVPELGRVPVLVGGVGVPRELVLARWKALQRLKETELGSRGWLISVLRCCERIGRPEFSLEEVYRYETALSKLFPQNNNVRPKIRQQLQRLRDAGIVEFMGRGIYRFQRRALGSL